MTDSGICIHGGLRRQCEPCDLANRLEQAEAEAATLRSALEQASRCVHAFARTSYLSDAMCVSNDLDLTVRIQSQADSRST